MEQEKEFVRRCKTLIEKKLGWGPSAEWKQRDFLQLIELLESATGVLLSLSTIRRIWKPNFDGIPHPATLEALARFLGHSGWLDFKAQNQSGNSFLLVPGEPALVAHSQPFKQKKVLVAGGLTLAIGLVLAAAFFQIRKSTFNYAHGVIYDPATVTFTCKNALGLGVPNTVIFEYDVSKVIADSFFIQQSWNKSGKEKITKQGSNLTSTYFYPGFHRAKLIANDSVILETNVQVNTNGWLAIFRNGYEDNAPVYIRDGLLSNEYLHVPPDRILENRVSISSKTITSFYNIGAYKGLSSGSFCFETRLKCDSIVNVACPFIHIIIQGDGEMYYLPIVAKGCVGNIGVKLGDVVKSGRDHDLSAFGTNVYEWQRVRLEVKNQVARVFLNNQPIMEQPFVSDIGNIRGVNINFAGTGSAAYVRLAPAN